MIGAALIAACFALTALVYTRLPDPMPTHFDLSGHADGFSPKPLGPFKLPLIALAAYGLALWAPGISRRRAPRALRVLPLAIAALFLFLVAVILRTALGHALDLGRVMLAAASLYVMVRGNYLGTVPRNWWIGIRTPWTLRDDEVWHRTNRLAGQLSVLGGPLAFMACIAGAPPPVVLAPLVAAGVVAAVYSYVVYRRLRASRVRS
jgi:uncharacterized membrane protein